MNKQFDSLNFDPLLASELISLLGVREYDVTSPRSYNKFKEVVNFFQNIPNYRYKILKILSKDRNSDSLETVWTYVALENEKQTMVQSLPIEDIDETIVKQLKQGVLTRDNLKLLKKDVQTQLKKEKVPDTLDGKRTEAMDKVREKYSAIDGKLAEIEKLNNALSRFN